MLNEREITELVEAVLAGDAERFEELYRTTSQRVYFICLHFMKDTGEAEDMLQETYLLAFKRLKQLRDASRFPAWVEQIAVNQCKDRLKQKQPVLMEDEDMENLLPEENENFLPEDYILSREKRKLIMDIMRKQLSDIQYQTVILYYFNNLTVDEVADILECPPGTIKYRLNVARAKIKQGVEAYEKKHQDKLYSFAGVPVLALILAEEAKTCDVPEISAQLMETIHTLVSAAAAVQKSGTVAETVGKEIGKMAGKGLLASTGAKVAVGVGALLIVGGTITGVVLHNQDKQTKEPEITGVETNVDEIGGNTADQGTKEPAGGSDSVTENAASSDNTETAVEDTGSAEKSYDETLIGYVADGGAYINDYFGITIDLDDSVWEVDDYETVRAEYSMSDKPITERLLNNDHLTILDASHRSLDMQEDGVTPRQDMGWINITVQDKSASEYGDPRFREEEIPEEAKEEHFRSQVETVASTGWFSEKEDVMYVGTIQVGSMSGYYYVHEYVEYDGEPEITEDIYLYDGPLWVRILIEPWHYQAETMEVMYTRLEAIEAHFNSIQKTETEIITERMEKE